MLKNYGLDKNLIFLSSLF